MKCISLSMLAFALFAASSVNGERMSYNESPNSHKMYNISALAYYRNQNGEWTKKHFHNEDINVKEGAILEVFCTVETQNPSQSFPEKVSSPIKMFWNSASHKLQRISKTKYAYTEVYDNEVLYESKETAMHRGWTSFLMKKMFKCVSKKHQGFIQCGTISNDMERYSREIRINVADGHEGECEKTKPAITLQTKFKIAPIGSKTVLVCRTSAPTVSWWRLDSDYPKELPAEKIGDNRDLADYSSRMNVTPEGDLEISDLQWEDMGFYNCSANHGRNSVKSELIFLYPSLDKEANVKVEDNDIF